MRRSAQLGGFGLAVFGLALVVFGGGIWDRLLGLQAAMMGGYLATLASANVAGAEGALRRVLQARLALVAVELGLWALHGPSPLWLALPLAQLAWLLLTPGVVRAFKPDEAPAAQARHFSSPLHNVVLGAVPLLEGVGALFFAVLYGAQALGVKTPPDQLHAANLFGAHTLYLFVFWVLICRGRLRRPMAATAVGRLLVALAFVGLTLADLTGDGARFLILTPMLVCSAGWTLIELRWDVWAWVRSRGSRPRP